MKILVPLTIVSLVWCISAVAEPAPLQTYEQINANVTPANRKHFEDYLSNCSENEIRCVWFLNDHIKVGMLMTIDLEQNRVDTVREVYNWARQNSETRKLSHSQVMSVNKLIAELPPTLDNVPFGQGIHIAYRQDRKVQSVTYHRKAAPLILQRLYDIGGGYLDCKYATESTGQQ